MTWLIVLSANFIIDSLVILITLGVLKIPNKKEIYKETLKKVDMEVRAKKILAISLAVFTAPYLFLIPIISP